jgi:DNA-binding CsgD family transcriptional regulator
VPEAVAVLTAAAEATAPDDPAAAAEMLAEAAYAALYANPAADMDALAARALAVAPPDSARARATACVAAGAVGVLRGDPAADTLLAEAWELIESTPALRDDLALAAWLGVVPAFRRAALEEYVPLEQAIARARERGALGLLPSALFFVGVGRLGAGRWAEAAASFSEAVRLAEEAGLAVDAAASLAGLARIEARRGDPALAARALEETQAAGMPFFAAWALHAQGEAALAAGEAAAALAAFEAKRDLLATHGMHDPDLSPAPELAETLRRLGREEEAGAAAAGALADAAAKGQPWALARAHRATALTGDPAGFERALPLHAEAGDAFETARTQLCLGERLRRDGRRADAREPLRAALEGFEATGAAPWVARAADELRATGEVVRRRDPSTLDELTPQELRIASMLAAGATTRQAAAALYLSPKTVEYHLRHVYLKLGVHSRAALAAALAQSSPAISSAARAAPVSSTAR